MDPQDLIDLERTVQLRLNKAGADETFRRKWLTSNPQRLPELLERELGITLPAGVTSQVQKGIPYTIHLVQTEPQPWEPSVDE